ncbi:MAG: DNA mismatch repair endonuclease MutL [Candidatus Omnitrophica bacterium]|nr:DNA mismatch repair endonuclease MutL [Candidatus Omnitrophota bacterium]
MGKIQVLPKVLADKIAAGEVVERPASVVKELVENALDAQSTSVAVQVQDAGRRQIVVIDDGEGMSADDLARACERHATSKIKTDEDLERIQTLGFRGEALASIAAVSRVRITSCRQGAGVGHTLSVAGGIAEPLREDSRTQGTTVCVENLFFNTPARLKFLKSSATELLQISRVVTELALAFPQTALQLTHGREQFFAVDRTQGLPERIRILLGEELWQQMMPLELDLPPLTIRGYISRPAAAATVRKNQYLFVNGRPVQDRLLMHAVLQGYHSMLMDNRYPGVILFIQTPPDAVDVNVHPTKREIRLREAAAVHDLLAKVVRETLAGTRPLSSSAAFSVSPALNLGEPAAPEYGRYPRPATAGPVTKEAADSAAIAARVQAQGEQMLFRAMAAPSREQATGDPYLFVDDAYICMRDEQGLRIIDQHAAHERVLFDELSRQFQKRQVEKQRLLLPVTLQLNAAQQAVLVEHTEMLAACGFEIEPFGNQTVAIQTYPALFGAVDIAAVVLHFLDELGALALSAEVTERVRQILAPLACHAAVRARERLNAAQVQALLERLEKTDAPATCPHGRPTTLLISRQELSRRFKRS